MSIRDTASVTRGRWNRSVYAGAIMLLIAGMLATAITAVAPRAARGQTEPLVTAQAAPETALFYAAVNLDRESAQWALAGELLDRAGFADAVAQALEDADVGAAEQTVLDAVFGGEAALVLSEFPETGDLNADDAAGTITDPAAIAEGAAPEGFSIILAANDPDAAFDVLSDQLEETATESGGEVESTEYSGVEILSVAAEDEFDNGQAIARVEDFVVFATTPEDVQPVVDTVNGDIAPLAEEENFSQLRGDLNQEFLALGFINGPALLDGIEASDQDALAALGEETTAAFNAYTGFVTWADDPGFRVDTLSIPGEGREIGAADPVDTALAERVPADSLVYVSGTNLGSTPGLAELGLVLAQAVVGDEPGAAPPEGTDQEAYAEEVFAEAEEQLGFNIKTDFIDQMVGPFAFAFTADDLFGGSPVIDGVLASGTENPETVSGVVDQIGMLIASAIGSSGEISTRDVDGSTVQVVDLSSSGFPLIVELGVVEDEFILGVGNGLTDFVEGPDESLAESENFQGVMGELPTAYATVTYVNLEQVIALVEEVQGDLGGNVTDADPACGEFETQEEAQAAYDEDPFENFALNQDFDDTACEDFFAPATPEPETGSQFANIKAFATVTFVDGDRAGTSSLLYIADE